MTLRRSATCRKQLASASPAPRGPGGPGCNQVRWALTARPPVLNWRAYTAGMDNAELGVSVCHVCYTYVAFLAGALQMLRPHPCPVNVLIQDATLVHLRALAEFFQFRQGDALGPPSRINEERPNLRAQYYCDRPPCWTSKHFQRKPPSNLMMALDRGLAHLSLGRALSDACHRIRVPWHGPAHLHGAVMLILDTWDAFLRCINPCFENDIASGLKRHEHGFEVSLSEFRNRFTAEVSRLRVYQLNALP